MILIFVIICLIFFFYNLTKLKNYIDFQRRFIEIEQIEVLDEEKIYFILRKDLNEPDKYLYGLKSHY